MTYRLTDRDEEDEHMRRDLPPALRRYLLTEAELTNEEVDGMTTNELFETVLNYEGLINYANKIKRIIKDVYGIDLDKVEEVQG